MHHRAGLGGDHLVVDVHDGDVEGEPLALWELADVGRRAEGETALIIGDPFALAQRLAETPGLGFVPVPVAEAVVPLALIAEEVVVAEQRPTDLAVLDRATEEIPGIHGDVDLFALDVFRPGGRRAELVLRLAIFGHLEAHTVARLFAQLHRDVVVAEAGGQPQDEFTIHTAQRAEGQRFVQQLVALIVIDRDRDRLAHRGQTVEGVMVAADQRLPVDGLAWPVDGPIGVDVADVRLRHRAARHVEVPRVDAILPVAGGDAEAARLSGRQGQQRVPDLARLLEGHPRHPIPIGGRCHVQVGAIGEAHCHPRHRLSTLEIGDPGQRFVLRALEGHVQIGAGQQLPVRIVRPAVDPFARQLQEVHARAHRLAVLADQSLSQKGGLVDLGIGRHGPRVEQVGHGEPVPVPSLPGIPAGQRDKVLAGGLVQVEGDLRDVAVGDDRLGDRIGVVGAHAARAAQFQQRVIVPRGEVDGDIFAQQVAVWIGDLARQGDGVGRGRQLRERDVQVVVPLVVTRIDPGRFGQNRHCTGDEAGRIHRAGEVEGCAAGRVGSLGALARIGPGDPGQ